eukprot:11199576-Lingulodinium_polyedra.AAC.1
MVSPAPLVRDVQHGEQRPQQQQVPRGLAEQRLHPVHQDPPPQGQVLERSAEPPALLRHRPGHSRGPQLHAERRHESAPGFLVDPQAGPCDASAGAAIGRWDLSCTRLVAWPAEAIGPEVVEVLVVGPAAVCRRRDGAATLDHGVVLGLGPQGPLHEVAQAELSQGHGPAPAHRDAPVANRHPLQ